MVSSCDDLKTKRERAICEGRAQMPLFKTNRYRALWGLPALLHASPEPRPVLGYAIASTRDRSAESGGPRVRRPCGGCSGVKTTKKRPRAPNGYGPGSQLLRIYEDRGYEHCDDCVALASEMDAWGVDGCRAKLDTIVEQILPRGLALFRERHPRVAALLTDAQLAKAARKRITADVRLAASLPRERRRTKARDRRVEDLLSRTEICVKSFLRHGALLRFLSTVRDRYPQLRVRVVDDSLREGEQPSAEMRRAQQTPGVTWLSLPYDSGLPAGRNLAVRTSDAEYVVVCDDDFLFTDHTDLGALLLPVADPKARIDLCGGLVRMDGKVASNWCGNLSLRQKRGKRTLTMTRVSAPFETLACGVQVFRSSVTYNFFAARREVLLQHPWDESFKISQEHLDSFTSWHVAGVRVAYTTQCICSHQKSGDAKYKKLRRRSLGNKILRKWGISTRETISTTKFPGV